MCSAAATTTTAAAAKKTRMYMGIFCGLNTQSLEVLKNLLSGTGWHGCLLQHIGRGGLRIAKGLISKRSTI